MADINKFTTKEVLNKVLLDSSGDAVAAFSHTTQEALNAVLDTTNNRLNVSIAGGTISGDVTINGDLTVNGDGSGNYDEIVNGNLEISSNGVQLVGNLNYSFLTHHSSMTRGIALGHDGGAAAGFISAYGASSDLIFATHNGTAYGERMRLDHDGNLAIGKSDSVMSGLGTTNTKLTLYNSSYAGNLELAGNSSSDDALVGSIWFSNEDNADDTNVDADSKLIATIDVRTETTDSNAHDDSGSHIIFKTKPEAGTLAEAMRIDSAGRVGIGTASPSDYNSGADNLVIADSADVGITLASGTTSMSQIFFADGTSGDAEYRGVVRYDHNADNMQFWTSATTRMKLDANSRISLSNNDSGSGGADSSSGNTIFGNLAGGNLDSGSVNNVLIGHHTGKGLSGSTNTYTGNVLIGGNSGRDITQGDENVAVGYNAGRYIQQGGSNTLIGHNAGNAVLHANNNTIVGANAGDAISSGANNSILGTAALSTATTALNNVFIGRSAGEDIPAGQALDGAVAIGWEAFKGSGSTTTGADNTIAIGKEALKSLTTGVGNVAIGYQSGDAITSGGANVALGYQSLSNVLTGSGNVAIGYQALLDADNNEEQNIAIGQQSMENLNYNGSGNNIAMGLFSMKCGTVAAAITDNIAIGQYTLSAITHGSLNVAIGGNALAAATTATSNVAIGKNAMLDNTTGGYTVAIGREALANINDDGNDGSVAIGYAAGQNQVGSGTQYDFANTLIGRQSGKTITTGALNTALGFESCGGVHEGTALTGSNNVAVGHKAGRLMEGASSDNTLIGSLSGDAITTGSQNTALGYQAVSSVSTSGSNTGVGYRAMKDTTGERNTTLGYQAGNDLVGGSNNTLIGYDVDTDTATTNHQTVIGSGGVFKFQSMEYTCDHASNDDNDIASSTTPIKIPARAVIKSVSAIVTQLSNLGTYTLAVFYSDDSTPPNDDSGLTNGVELIGAGASPSKSGSSGSTEDIEVPASGGVPVKAAWYQGFDGNGKHVGTTPKYIHIVNAGTGNGDTDPSQAAKIKILVEYVGQD